MPNKKLWGVSDFCGERHKKFFTEAEARKYLSTDLPFTSRFLTTFHQGEWVWLNSTLAQKIFIPCVQY